MGLADIHFCLDFALRVQLEQSIAAVEHEQQRIETGL